MKTTCEKCGSSKIEQECTIYLNPNDPKIEKQLDWIRVNWEDFYWCMECDEECRVIETQRECKGK